MPKHKHRAIPQRYRPLTVGDIRTRERAWLPCGCAIYVGRDGQNFPQTRSQPCRVEHTLVTERADALMREQAQAPKVGRPMLDVAVLCLGKAAKELL